MRGSDPSGCCGERSAYSPRAVRQQQATDAEQRGLTTVAAMRNAQACHRGARDDRAEEARADRIGRVTLRLLDDVPSHSARSLSSRLLQRNPVANWKGQSIQALTYVAGHSW